MNGPSPAAFQELKPCERQGRTSSPSPAAFQGLKPCERQGRTSDPSPAGARHAPPNPARRILRRGKAPARRRPPAKMRGERPPALRLAIQLRSPPQGGAKEPRGRSRRSRTKRWSRGWRRARAGFPTCCAARRLSARATTCTRFPPTRRRWTAYERSSRGCACCAPDGATCSRCARWRWQRGRTCRNLPGPTLPARRFDLPNWTPGAPSVSSRASGPSWTASAAGRWRLTKTFRLASSRLAAGRSEGRTGFPIKSTEAKGEGGRLRRLRCGRCQAECAAARTAIAAQRAEAACAMPVSDGQARRCAVLSSNLSTGFGRFSSRARSLFRLIPAFSTRFAAKYTGIRRVMHSLSTGTIV